MTWNALLHNDSSFRRAFLAGGLAFLAAMLLLSPRMFLGPLRHWDEAWYAQVSREMLAADDWLTPRWNGEPWFHKPPLAFWGTMASFSTFGISEPAARLFSAVCGSLTVGLLAAFLAHQFSLQVGLLGALLLLMTSEFSRYAARGQLDGPLTLFLTLQLTAFWFARTNPRWHWLAGAACGLAVMTKGAAAGLPFVVIGVFSLATRDFGWLRQRSFWSGIALAMAIALPWHVHQLVMHGDKFLQDYGARHFIQFFNPIPGEDTPGPSSDYYFRFLSRSAPFGWISLLLIGSAGAALIVSRDPLVRFAAAWTFAIPVALSFARTKWSWYLTPMYPGAMLFAVVAASVAFRSAKGRLFAERKATLKPLFAVCLLTAFGVACEPFVVGAKEGEAEIKALAPIVQASVPPEAGLHTLQLGKVRRSVYPIAPLYYSQRRTYAIHSLDELGRVMTGPRCLHLLLREAEIESLPLDGVRLERVAQSGDVAYVRLHSAGVVNAKLPPREVSESLSAN
jgi:4-amino-4-deoxy-L-arabinose transferase-like glycosyltransferase